MNYKMLLRNKKSAWCGRRKFTNIFLIAISLIVGNNGLSDQLLDHENYLVSTYRKTEGAFAPRHVDASIRDSELTSGSSEGQDEGEVIWGYEGRWKELLCLVKANPPARFIWSFEGNPLTHSPHFIFSNPEKNFSILKVELKKWLQGGYKCRAENELGASEIKIFLGVGARPPIPKFVTQVKPGIGVWINVTGIKEYSTLFQNPSEISHKPAKEEIGEKLPAIGFVLQSRIFRSCDDWIETFIPRKKFFLRGILQAGQTYRMRLAIKTKAGVGEFSNAQTVHFDEGFSETTTPILTDCSTES